MLVKKSNGKTTTWSPRSYPPKDCSRDYARCRDLLKSLFPDDTILERVGLAGTSRRGKARSIADFVLVRNDRPIAVIDVRGDRHYQLVKWLRLQELGLTEPIKDKKKARWCKLNELEFIELPHYESAAAWTKKLKSLTDTIL